VVFEQLYAAGKIELELVPQGTLSGHACGGAGIGGFYTRTAVNAAREAETRTLDSCEATCWKNR
jgi:3-oxoadipate CoA-transferase alpha subunit